MIDNSPAEFEAWHLDYESGPEAVTEPQPEHIRGMPVSDILTPSDRYQELFVEVQMSRIFSDSKTFADSSPKSNPEDIMSRYYVVRERDDFDLLSFVLENFDLPQVNESHYVSDPDKTIEEHIDTLWPVLTRQPQEHGEFSSLLPLPKPYVVPGGRFGETYYWDSYFSMLGFASAGRCDLMRDMADNFAWLIDKYGHIPNGNRTYYLSRSQPPVFAMMVELFEKNEVNEAQRYLRHLKSEYAFWMDGEADLEPNQAYRHVVKMPDGSLLNRYWDDRDTPRDESYVEDVETALESSRPSSEVYRDLRAGAASGWDYTSRWLSEPGRLASIQTTSIIPVDLNAFLYKLEMAIARLSAARGDQATADRYQQLALHRQEAVDRYLWDDKDGLYRDYNWRDGEQATFTAASVTPVYVGMSTLDQATRTAKAVRENLLAAGGLLCSTDQTGEQWDSPNGWAPMQWMAVKGFGYYGIDDLAESIARRWLKTVTDTYHQHHKMVEKYNVNDGASLLGAGGEYPLQDGFGWTNGVTRRLLEMYPLE